MPESQIKELINLSSDSIKKIQKPLEDFLNHYTLNELNLSNNEPIIEQKNKEFLSDMRHLLVSCENTLNKLRIVLQSNKFNKDLAEHALYETVHLCVNKFFYPEHEVYEEDGRNSYTGKDAIKFTFDPHPALKELVVSLSKYFEVLREELNYYETDYVTKKRLEGKMI